MGREQWERKICKEQAQSGRGCRLAERRKRAVIAVGPQVEAHRGIGWPASKFVQQCRMSSDAPASWAA